PGADAPNGWEVSRRSRQMERRRARRAAREAQSAPVAAAAPQPAQAEAANFALAEPVQVAAADDIGFSLDALEDSLAGFEAEARDNLARGAVPAAPETASEVQNLIARMGGPTAA